MKPLRVGIEARLPDGIAGGIQQVFIGLAAGLSSLTDSDEEYCFVVAESASAWLTPYLSGPARAIALPNAPVTLRQKVRSAVKNLIPEPARRLVRRSRESLRALRDVQIASSDGVFEGLNCDLVHFPLQRAFLTDIPFIYHPHDLQHRHLPEYFTPEAIRVRDANYQAFCRRAALVAVTSSWVKADLVTEYGLPAEKVAVIPLAPVLDSYPQPTTADLARTRAALKVPETFAFYPAQTWPHKNHIGLLRGLKVFLDANPHDNIHLVCSGTKNDFFPEIERVIAQLGLQSRVSFVGFVTPLEIQALYRMATCVVIPSRFEAASFPLWEAFLAGVPAACSRVTSLPAQAGDAALLFDPDEPQEIAAAIQKLWFDADLRRRLVESGRQLVQGFTWDRTARQFRAHYRRLAGRSLSEEDRSILDAPPRL